MTKTTITKEELDRLWNALEYTWATISPSGNFKSKENPGWVEIHGGRAQQSEIFLIAAIDNVDRMRNELKTTDDFDFWKEEKIEPSMTNCVILGDPPCGYVTWNDWYNEQGSKGILHNLRISSKDCNG